MPRSRSGIAGIAAEAAIVRLCAADLPPLALLEEVSRRVRSVVPYAAAGWLPTDPATLLHTSAFSEDVPSDVHMRLIDNELTADDFAKFSDVARLPRPVLRLSEATAGELERSPRHRTLNQPAGWRAELRVAFRTRGACWGVACMTRMDGEPDFSDAETEFVARVAAHVGHGLRTALLLDASAGDSSTGAGPGMVILTDEDEVEALTGEAEHWLSKLPADGLTVPAVVLQVARRARAHAESGRAGPPARARVLLPSGRWLLVHGARLRSRSAGTPRTAVVLEPARGADLAPLIVELYELTDREREVTRLLARGMPVEQIAASLWISPHTARDHTKAIFAKLGVSSRPELTALLFHEHVLPSFRGRTGSNAS